MTKHKIKRKIFQFVFFINTFSLCYLPALTEKKAMKGKVFMMM